MPCAAPPMNGYASFNQMFFRDVRRRRGGKATGSGVVARVGDETFGEM